jgi:aldose 1-epimerase
MSQTTVTKSAFGKLPNGQAVDMYTLKSAHVEVKLITFGARITAISAPDRAGKQGNIVLGYDNLEGYLADTKTYFGAIVGRYGNRIAKAAFSLDGKQYHLPANNNGNTLHGGTEGFDRRNWSAHEIPSGVEFILISKDGDQGFPGTLTAHVRYTLEASRLTIHYNATTDKDTVVNLTNHAYYNLSGSGDILGDQLTLNADRYTPVDSGLIPTGRLMPVAGTPFDFRHATAIGARIHASDEQLRRAGGYDHNFILNAGGGAQPRLAAKVVDPKSGRTLAVWTSEPAVQFYSGNFLDGSNRGHGGTVYAKHAGLCLETQHYPDSPNHPAFPSTELKPGQIYRSTTVLEFGAVR